jgi:hypothetical protein
MRQRRKPSMRQGGTRLLQALVCLADGSKRVHDAKRGIAKAAAARREVMEAAVEEGTLWLPTLSRI